MKTLETERLILKKWERRDGEALFSYAKNPNVGPHAGWKPHENVKESRRIIKELFIPNDVWKIIWKEEDRIIGSIGLEKDKRRPGVKSFELGYSLAEEYWGRGIMTEAGKAVMRYAFTEMKAEVMSITTGPENLRSQSTIKKLGFKYEGHERYAYLVYDGTVRDTLVYSLLKDEYFEGSEL